MLDAATATTAPTAILLTDLVDSSALSAELGDARMAAVWAAHDRMARDLLLAWRGTEVDKSDGFLLLFDAVTDAVGYALAYHRGLASMQPPLHARAGVHVGVVQIRPNAPEDVARGAKAFEVDGVAKPLAARAMGGARGGQTLLTRPALDALQPALQAAGAAAPRVMPHGHWRAKGLPEPMELFEVGEPDAPFSAPPDSDKLWRVVRQGDHWLPLREQRHSLPAERDAFVGRGHELQSLSRLFARGARLVSVLGIGGGGKTRLAQHFGWSHLGDFGGSVWFCDLAAARGPDGIVHAVAAGLGITLDGDDAVQRLSHAIAGRGDCLLVLDNFEQVARHAPATLGAWLDRAPQASFLVTTREVLGLPGEVTLALAPLPGGEAQALFMRRAAAARAGIEPAAEDRAAITQLVSLLDGLPLAIELAAARVRVMTPRALLARMSERFRVLASSGGRHDRQATLRATFDWSWDLLGAAEKGALAQISVFEGRFTIEAAEAVVDLGVLQGDADGAVASLPWTLDLLQSLVDKSFLRLATLGHPGAAAGHRRPGVADGEGRFELLGSVRAYAAEHLATPGRMPGSGPECAAATARRHGAWYAALGPQRVIEDGAADLDDLAAACRRAVVAGEPGIAAGALEGAWAALQLQGPFSAAVDLARSAAAMPSLQGAEAARVGAVLATALDAIGERDAALPLCTEALATALRCRATRCAAEAGVTLGNLHWSRGDADAATAALRDALTLARQADEPRAEIGALNALGTVAFERGLLEEARGHYEAALARAEALGDRRWQGGLRGNLGNLHASQGQMDIARGHCEAALAAASALGDRQREGNQLCNLGMMELIQGRLPQAEAACAQGLAVAIDLGHVRLQAIVGCNAGLVSEAQGDATQAEAHFRRALQVAQQLGDARSQGQFLGHIGRLQARRGDAAAARDTLVQGQALLRASDDRLGLGQLLCALAEAEAAAGDTAACAAALAEATLLAQAGGAGPDSELGQALADTQRRLAALRSDRVTMA